VHFADLTTGKAIYGGGRRIIRFQDVDELTSAKALDFNYAVSCLCALSIFVVCPSTPRPTIACRFASKPVNTVRSCRTIGLQRIGGEGF